MGKVESLGIKRLESVHYYVRDLERSRRFYTELLGWTALDNPTDRAEQLGARVELPPIQTM